MRISRHSLPDKIVKDRQYYKFCAYGFLRNMRFFEAFLILYLVGKGFSYTTIGVFYGVREISANILEIPSGISADVLGRKKTLAASFLVYILSFLLFFLFSSPLPFIAGFFLFGVGEAFRSGTHKGMIADYLKRLSRKDQMIEYYGHTRSWSQIGLALSSLIAGFIVFVSGDYQLIFLLSIIPYLLNFLLILSYPDFLDKSSALSPGGKRDQFKEVLSRSVKTISDRSVLKLLNISALHTAYLKAMKDYIQPMIYSLVITFPLLSSYSDEQRSAVFIGLFYFFIFILTSKASAYAGKFAKISVKRLPMMTLIAGLLSGVFSGVLYFFQLPAGAVFFFLLIYLIENVRKPVLTGYVSENVDNSILTSVFSIQSQMKTVMTALIAILFGFAADRVGIAMALIIISTALIFLSLIVSVPGRKSRGGLDGRE